MRPIMRRLAILCALGMFVVGCCDDGECDACSCGAGGTGGASEQGGAAGATPSPEGGASSDAPDCTVTEDDDVCSECVKNTCCDEWWTCLDDCAVQVECYQVCLQDRGSLTAENDTACREECDVADEKKQNALIECLVPEDSDAPGCREECF